LLAGAQDGIARLAQSSADCQQTLVRIQQQVIRLQEAVQNAAARLEPPDIQKMLAAASAVQEAARKAQPPAVPPAASPAPAAPAAADLGTALVQHLQQQKRQAPLRPLDLPQLFKFAQSRQPSLSLGAFHDLVRGLAERGRIRLTPFTQAMYQLPEPQYALLVGREIMYYVEGV